MGRLDSSALLRKIESMPSWVAYNVFSLLVVGFMFTILLPVHYKVAIPGETAQDNLSLRGYTCPSEVQDILPDEHDAVLKKRVEAQGKLMGFYTKAAKTDGAWNSTIYLKWLAGIMDVAITAQALDPDSETLSAYMSGQAYGGLTYSGNTDLLALTVPSLSAGINHTTPIKSCKISSRAAGNKLTGTGSCADLIIALGTEQASYSTGDGLGLRLMNISMTSSRNLAHYPFDSYTASGFIRATVAMQLSQGYALLALRAALNDDASLSDDARQALQAGLSAWEAKLQPGKAFGLDAEMMEFSRNVDMRVELQPGLIGWVVSDHHLQKRQQRSPARTLAAGAGSDDDTVYEVLEFSITYERTAFTKAYAVFLVITMCSLGVASLVWAVDAVLVRQRYVWSWDVGYVVWVFLAMPFLRKLLEAPLGSYIDFLGFAWSLLLLTVAGVLMYQGMHASHKHNAKYTRMHEDEAEDVVLTEASQQRLARAVSSMLRAGARKRKSADA